MIIGIPKERKKGEGRVALGPGSVRILAERGHAVLIEHGAGELSGFSDIVYKKMGAQFRARNEVWKKSNLIVKVKEPLPQEYEFLRSDLTMMGFFHFPANKQLEEECLQSGVKTIPYEYIEDSEGEKPILREMSLVAGEIAADMAGEYLRTSRGGKGILLQDATVTVLGALGNVGGRACEILGERAQQLFGVDLQVTMDYGNKYGLFYPQDPGMTKFLVGRSDVVICAAVNKKGGAPHLVTRDMIRSMGPGSVFIDVAIDEGGGSETSRPTTYDNPSYIEEGIVHVCIANLPGGVPRSSSVRLDNVLLPYVIRTANGENVLQ